MQANLSSFDPAALHLEINAEEMVYKNTLKIHEQVMCSTLLFLTLKTTLNIHQW